MIRHLLHVNFDGQRGLQEQVRESLINAILSGIFSGRYAPSLMSPTGWSA